MANIRTRLERLEALLPEPQDNAPGGQVIVLHPGESQSAGLTRVGDSGASVLLFINPVSTKKETS